MDVPSIVELASVDWLGGGSPGGLVSASVDSTLAVDVAVCGGGGLADVLVESVVIGGGLLPIVTWGGGPAGLLA
jgi:hypothetical protein